MPDTGCLFIYISVSLCLCVRRQDCEISQLRTKHFELMRDIQARCRELKNSAVQLDKAKAQAQLHREHTEHLWREKSDLERQNAVLKQTAAEVNANHASQIDEQVLSVITLPTE